MRFRLSEHCRVHGPYYPAKPWWRTNTRRALFFLTATAAALAGAGALYQAIGSYRDRRRHRPPGRLVETECGRLHLHEQGAGTPAVVLESGIAATSLSWAPVQREVARFTRVCSYDRAGLGWSSPCRAPRTVEQMVSELAALLKQAGIPAPYVLVGHSFGGLLIRAYAHLRGHEVCGLLLVDPVSIAFWSNCDRRERQRLEVGVKLSRRGAWLARFGVVRLALSALTSGARRFPQLIARTTAGRGTTVVQRLVGEVAKLPRDLWPPVRSHWTQPKSFEAMANYLHALPDCAAAAAQMSIPPEIPFTVLSAGTATGAELEERDRWVAQSRNRRHMVVQGTGHWLQMERPDVVVDAIRRLHTLAPKAKTPRQLQPPRGLGLRLPS